MSTSTPSSKVLNNHLEAIDSQAKSRKQLQHMATIDLGSLQLEFEDHHMMNRSKSHQDPFPSLRIVHKKEYWYKTSPKEKRKKATKGIKKSQSMGFDEHSEGDELDLKLFKHPSETDVHDFPQMKAFESRDVDVSDIYVKVPKKT